MSCLGLDLGTSGLRALLVGSNGMPIGSAEQSYVAAHPAQGWSEQDPADWTVALERAVDDLRAAYPEFADLQGIAVAGHMHGATLLDNADRVLRPCILWNDTRSHVEAAALDADPQFRALSGNIVFPGFTAPKLLWVKQHEPEVFAKVAKVLLPAAYMNLYLTGDHVADMSDSAGTSWLDTSVRDWSDDLLTGSGMTRGQMPRLVEGSEVAGTLRPELAQRWGVGPNVCVAGGAGDNAAAACGMGAFMDGQGFVSLGTSGVMLIARSAYHPAPETALHTFCHAVPDKWYQMGVMLSATDSLNWLARVTGHSPAVLTERLGTDLRPQGDVGFLPYLSGERTPHNDADIRGAFTGLGVNTTLEDMTHAVLAGVSFGLRDSFQAIAETGGRYDRLFAIGGGAKSGYWLRLLATVLNMPLHLPAGQELGAALGAARLAMAAATGQAAGDIMTAPDTEAVIAPDTVLSDHFEDQYQLFRRTYPALKSIR